ncbi:MAG: geranylgeranylglycerol-phosphate geranylgeranyltransferase [Bacteroidales bacterium]|jgi:4-hydroxybenzoate polyprenyltransferase|nr:geranylgeranylglycerol-phosphate geranylgeranyltransferase [Bacteroidales bacterium]
MKSFLKLIRWQNLVIVALTMTMMRYAVLEPLLGKLQVIIIQGSVGEAVMELQFPPVNFIFLIAATIFIAAGGYVINDCFDIKTDIINRGKVIVGYKISRRRAMALYNAFSLAGVALGFFISWQSGYLLLGVMFLIVSGLLYFYSASYKRQFLIGNIMIAFLTAMTPLLVAIYEWPAVYRFYSANAAKVPELGFMFYWTGGFAVFAFITTLIREIIKDIEDYEGDKVCGHNTLPIMLGVSASKIIAAALIVITITMLYAVWYLFLFDKYTLAYISTFIALPLAAAIIIMFRGAGRKHIHVASTLMKIVMITGIFYSIVVKILMNCNLV